MIRREVIDRGVKVFVLILCVLFRMLLGGDKTQVNNKVGLNHKNTAIFEGIKHTKCITSELILNDIMVCVSN